MAVGTVVLYDGIGLPELMGKEADVPSGVLVGEPGPRGSPLSLNEGYGGGPVATGMVPLGTALPFCDGYGDGPVAMTTMILVDEKEPERGTPVFEKGNKGGLPEGPGFDEFEPTDIVELAEMPDGEPYPPVEMVSMIVGVNVVDSVPTRGAPVLLNPPEGVGVMTPEAAVPPCPAVPLSAPEAA